MTIDASWQDFVAAYGRIDAYWYVPKGATADSNEFREKFRIFDLFEATLWTPETQRQIAQELRAERLSHGSSALPRQLKRVFENLGLCWIADKEPIRITPAGKAFLLEKDGRSTTLDTQVWRYQLPNPVNSSSATAGISLHPHAFFVECLLRCGGEISGEELVLFISRVQTADEMDSVETRINAWRDLKPGQREEITRALSRTNYPTIKRDHSYSMAFHHCDLLLQRNGASLLVTRDNLGKLKSKLAAHKAGLEIVKFRNEPDFIARSGDPDFSGTSIDALDYYVDVSDVKQAVKIYRKLPPSVRGQLTPEEFERAQFLEKDLEEYLEDHLEDIEEGLSLVGRQFATKVGPIDLFAKSKSGDLVVLELKKGRAADKVFGQICRYMGCIKSELPRSGPSVRGYVIAREFDEKIQYATRVVDKDAVKLQVFEPAGEKGTAGWIRIPTSR